MNPISKKSSKHLKVLIVEDDVSTRKLEQIILERAGYITLEAENGAVALELLDTEHTDVILLDILMAEMSGIEFLRLAKSNPMSAKIPVILCTSVSEQDSVQQAASLGIDGYILKPINAKDLLQKMQSVEKHIAPILVEPIKTTNKLGLDLKAYEQLLRVLVEDARQRLRDIGGQVEAGDFKAFHLFVRDLSSSAESLGAHALHRAALEASAFAPDSGEKVPEKYFLKIGSEIERVSRAISNI